MTISFTGHEVIRDKAFLLLLILLSIFACCTNLTKSAPPASGYDVVLLVGQSNMVGVGRGPDDATDAATSLRVWQWNPNRLEIVEARDPLFQNQSSPNAVGLGMTFAKAYVKSVGAKRNVLLVGSAANHTTFVSGRWRAPFGDLATTAVERSNAAMAAAGADARFAGVLWLQGEGDITGGGANGYQADLVNLISYFRTHIKGATPRTPFIVGEMSHEWLDSNLRDPILSQAQSTVLKAFHTLPQKVPYTACVSSADLESDEVNGIIHFSAMSQRQLGRRYADKFFEAAKNLGQTSLQQQSFSSRPNDRASSSVSR